MGLKIYKPRVTMACIRYKIEATFWTENVILNTVWSGEIKITFYSKLVTRWQGPVAATNQSPVGTMTNGPKVLLRTLLDQANATQWVEINFPAILVTLLSLKVLRVVVASVSNYKYFQNNFFIFLLFRNGLQLKFWPKNRSKPCSIIFEWYSSTTCPHRCSDLPTVLY